MNRYINPGKPLAPWSFATQGNGLIFTSGHVSQDMETGRLEHGDIEDQTRRVLTNLAVTLEAAGSGLDKVLKVTVLLSDMADFEKMNEVYRLFFTGEKPARTTYAVDLYDGLLVEMEAVAEV